MTPRQAVLHLKRRDYTQESIVDALKKKRIKAHQTTISRIENGEWGDNNYRLGTALVELAESVE